MIITDTLRTPPTEWTDANCRELFNHARYLGLNGNPAGFLLTVDIFSYTGYEDENGKRYLKDPDEWDYDGIRIWIHEHRERVTRVWQFDVKDEY